MDVPRIDEEAAIPAASLLLMRERPHAAPEWLVVERAKRLAFAGGAHAFPGGRIDAADRAAAAAYPMLDSDDAAARIAAVRETAEETGILLGEDDAVPAAMTPFARWRAPPQLAPRRFDTRFYLARLSASADPHPDGAETVAAFWTTAADLLARGEAGEARLFFPTRRLLERLARFATYEDARAEAERLPSGAIEAVRDGDWLRIPEGLGYPITTERIETFGRR